VPQPPSSDADSIVITSSPVMVVGTVVGGLIAVAFAVFLLVTQGVTVATGIVALIALGLVAVVLFDVPLSATFDQEGIVRRAMLRRHFIAWSRVRRLGRMRSGILRTMRAEVKGGLVAEVGGRSYVLVDRTESPLEFDELRRVLGERTERLGLDDSLRPGRRRPNGGGSWVRRR
jgi:hypothetical protein